MNLKHFSRLAACVIAVIVLEMWLGAICVSRAMGEPSVGAVTATISDPSVFLPYVYGKFGGLEPDCRLGVSGGESYLYAVDPTPFRFSSFLDFGTDLTPTTLPGIEYVQTIRIKQKRGTTGSRLPGYTMQRPWTLGELGEIVRNNPGSIWVVGNEPDRDTIQDDTYPEVYAQAYYDIYHYIKALDPTARIANASLVGFTPGREQYLNKVWDEYLRRYGAAMPVDIWTMHGYVLWESGGAGAHIALGTDPALAIPLSHDCPDPNSICYAEHDNMDLFKAQVERMRRWMKAHGQQDKPLIMTEAGILYYWDYVDEYGNNFGPERVSRFQTSMLDYLLNTTDVALGYPSDGFHLVQQVYWFSLFEYQDSAANLIEGANPYKVTPVGLNWQSYVARLASTRNLLVARVPTGVGFTDNTGVATAPLSVTIRNSGSAALKSSFMVTFYSDAALTQAIEAVTVTEDLAGCAMRDITVSGNWQQKLEPGMHQFWVKVDSRNQIAETSESDNVGSGVVFIDPQQIRLPIITR